MPTFTQHQRQTQKNSWVSPTRRNRLTFPSVPNENQLLPQPQALGNQTMQRLLQTRAIQAKLTVSQPDDEYEKEADQVADAVMRMPEPTAPLAREGSREEMSYSIQHQGNLPGMQRLCSECEEELQRQPVPELKKEDEEEHKKRLLQTKEIPGQTPQVTPNNESHIQHVLNSSGHPLPESVRSFFEPRFGYDLSQVQVHTDKKAAKSAQAVNALAYTVEQHHIVFGAGHYKPETSAGRRLLAHELTHVVQQTGGKVYFQENSDSGSCCKPSSLSDERSMIQRVNPPEKKESSETDEITFPPEHPARIARLEALKGNIQPYREMRQKYQNELANLPKVCTNEEETRTLLEQEKTLKNEIVAVEKYLIDLLGNEIDLINEALKGLYNIIPTQSGPDIPKVKPEIYEEINRLEAEKRIAEQEQLALRRGRAREDIQEIEKRLRELPPESEERKALEERKKDLGEFLSGTATNREPPGKHGRGSDGQCYVVYQNMVKVEGSLNWRFNNRGSLGPRPADKEWPPGAIGFVPGGTDCSGSVGLFIFADEEASRQAVERWVDSAVKGGAYVGNFLLNYSHEGQKYLNCVHEQCPKVPVGTETQQGTDSVSLANLSSDQVSCIKQAIFFCESGSAKKGTEYSCSNTSDPIEYRRMLGCEE